MAGRDFAGRHPVAWFLWWFVAVPALVVLGLESAGCHGGPFR